MAPKAARSLVIGTAGHIDHGKTTLVRALTGKETDRLPEERERGITIELGFAPWNLGPGLEASIVDVPGHEGFVRTMVAGAGGLDAVMLVVSAEDGVMPQTREHINVCRLLGVEHGLVALTKVDRLEDDPEAVELAVEDVRDALAGTVFEQAPIIPCSGQTGAGIDELRATMKRIATKIPRRDSKGDVILPLDRVFSIKGHGTIVTGTLLRGAIDLGKDTPLRLAPHGTGREQKDVRARAAQVRGGTQDRIVAGSRIALNLGGLETKELSRGDVLTNGVSVVCTETLHTWLHHLEGTSTPWKHGTNLQVCIGTAHAVGRVDPLHVEGETANEKLVVNPGQDALVRLRLDVPLPIWRDARIVVRAFSDPAETYRGRTVGGGTVLDPEPSTGRAQRARWVALGQALRNGTPADQVCALVRDAGALGIERDQVRRRCGVTNLDPLLAELVGGKRPELTELGGGRLVDQHLMRPLVEKAITFVDRFHADNPLKSGISRAALEASLGDRVAPDVAALAVTRAIERGGLRPLGGSDSLARPGKGLGADGELPAHMQGVLDFYTDRGMTPPTLKEVAAHATLDAREVLEIVGGLQRTGRLVKVTPELSLAKPSHDDLLTGVRARLQSEGTIDVQALKAMTGLTRKFVVPFMEHLDQLQITLRQGDRRIPGPRA